MSRSSSYVAEPYQWESLATIQQNNKETPENLLKASLIGIWKSIRVSKRGGRFEYEVEANKIYDEFMKLCKSRSEICNIADKFEATAESLKRENGTKTCPWDLDPLKKEPNEWETWAVEVIAAALQIPNFVDAKRRDSDVFFKQVTQVFEQATYTPCWMPTNFKEALGKAAAEVLGANPTSN